MLLISFLGLALTGLPLKYSHYDWAKGLAAALGGFDSTRIWHRLCAVVTLGLFRNLPGPVAAALFGRPPQRSLGIEPAFRARFAVAQLCAT